MSKNPFSDNAVAGMAMAAFELDRAILSMMVMSKTLPKRLILEMVEQCLMQVEKYQMSDHPALVEPAKAARLQIEGVIKGLKALPGDDREPSA